MKIASLVKLVCMFILSASLLVLCFLAFPSISGNELNASSGGQAWLRAKFGNVYSRSFIDVLIPNLASTDDYLGMYFVAYLTDPSKNTGADSRDGRELSLYDIQTPNYFTTLKNRILSKGIGLTDLGADSNWWATIGSGNSNAYIVEAFPGGADFVIPSGSTCPRPLVIFVTGTLIIHPNFKNTDINSACMFVVKGNVKLPSTNYSAGTVSNGVYQGITDEIDAYFVVTEGTFYTTLDPVASGQLLPLSNKFVLRGAVIADSIQFNRNLGASNNAQVPAEEFLYDPRFLVLLSNMLGEKRKSVFECGVIDAPECQGLNN
jgi:hypothetical protein